MTLSLAFIPNRVEAARLALLGAGRAVSIAAYNRNLRDYEHLRNLLTGLQAFSNCSMLSRGDMQLAYYMLRSGVRGDTFQAPLRAAARISGIIKSAARPHSRDTRCL